MFENINLYDLYNDVFQEIHELEELLYSKSYNKDFYKNISKLLTVAKILDLVDDKDEINITTYKMNDVLKLISIYEFKYEIKFKEKEDEYFYYWEYQNKDVCIKFSLSKLNDTLYIGNNKRGTIVQSEKDIDWEFSNRLFNDDGNGI